MSTRILVTGGAGFLGTHVSRALAADPDVELVVSADIRRAEPVDGVITEVVAEGAGETEGQ